MARERQIILDTETTGLYADKGDRLVEFAGIEMRGRKMSGGHLHVFVHPDRDIPEEAAAIHGITLERLESEGAPKFEVVGRQIADFLRGAELIIHNARFDVGFLNMEFRRMGLPSLEELDCEITDTLGMAREMFPGQKVNLDALCSRFEVDRSKRVFHGALIDCELLAEVYLAMTRSQFSLADAFDDGEVASVETAQVSRPAQLRVLLASEAEAAEHAAYLDGLDKEVGGSCVWRQVAQERLE